MVDGAMSGDLAAGLAERGAAAWNARRGGVAWALRTVTAFLPPALLLIGIVLLWAVLSAYGIIPNYILPSPGAIGHEVRSPAAAMKNTLAGIMQWDNTIDATGRRELLQEAYESSDRLLSLVESQLIIAKLETRHFEPSPERVDLGPALEGVMAVLHHRSV